VSTKSRRPRVGVFTPRRGALHALILLLAAILAACAETRTQSTPTPPQPAVSPVPRDVAVDIGLADTLYVQGETDRALEIYYAAVARGSEVERQDAVWKVARIQYEKGQNSAASQNAQAFLGTAPDPERQRHALLLLGYSEMAQGRNESAEKAFRTYVETGGPALPYAQLQLAEMAARRGDNQQAAKFAATALAADMPAGVRADGLLALAGYQEAADDGEAALSSYESVATNTVSDSDRAEALWHIALLARDRQDDARQQRALRDLITAYPGNDHALAALESSTEATAAERAYVLFRHRVNDDATAAYQALADDADQVTSGSAHYYLGILAERAGDPGQALNEYGAAIDALTGTGASLLGDAYWDRGLVLEGSARLDEAAAHFAAVADAVPDHAHAAEGLFRAGLIRYRQGLPAAAVELWQRYAQAAAGGDDGRSEFWLAKASAAEGDFVAQATHLQAAAAAAPSSYYGLRARAELSREGAVQDPSAIQLTTPQWATLEAWLTSNFGPEGLTSRTAFEASPAWQRGLELLGAGLFGPATDEIGPLADTADSPWTRYRIARSMYESGQIRLAARAAAPLLADEASPPATLISLVYPARYISQANDAASQEHVSPFLLLALVRQESFFDAGAVSSAGAMGLTQVIPATAHDIAVDLGVNSFNDADLLKPDVSLRFGAHYLAGQIAGFGGNLAAVLAAYNGGPGNAGRWAEASAGDPDFLLEEIDFTETRTYVEVVLSNYAYYRYAYGAADHLSLPQA